MTTKPKKTFYYFVNHLIPEPLLPWEKGQGMR